MAMEVWPLHKHTDLTNDCATILNTEWPRSNTARTHSLSKSCDQLPVALAFVQLGEKKAVEVLGFSKISAVQGIKNACLVESVIIREQDRGKGLGRILMNLTEDYAKKLGVSTAYLNTIDKQGFYSRLGYVKCQPVVSLGANAHRVPEEMLRQFLTTSLSSNEEEFSKRNGTGGTPPDTCAVNRNGSHSVTGDLQASKKDTSLPVSSHLQSISQSLPSVPPPPSTLPPPPPPPPPPIQPKHSPKTLDKSVARMDPHLVSWMKKDL